MAEKTIVNPQALYGLQFDVVRRVQPYINASGRTLYTGDVVVMANNTNAIAGPLIAGGSNTAGQLTNPAAGGGQLLVPGVSLTKVANDVMVVGIVGSRDDGYVDTVPGGISVMGSGSIGGGGTINNAGTLTAPTAATLPDFTAFPVGSVVPVIIEGPARIHAGGDASATTSIASGDLLTTNVGALGHPGAVKTATIGNLIAVAMETSVWSAANLQTGDAVGLLTSAASIFGGATPGGTATGLTVVAGTTAASATTVVTQTDPRSAANDGPSNKATTGIFPNTGAIQINDGGTLKTVAYSAIGATGFTVSATTVVTGITSGTTITYVQETIRCIVKRA